jgi:methyl-accepting chemotaxis protein
MGRANDRQVSYLKKVFFFTHLAGLAAGIIFPLLTAPFLGPAVRKAPFILSCLGMGLALGTVVYVFVRATLKTQLRQQLDYLRPLIGKIALDNDTVEGLQKAAEAAVAGVDTLIGELLATVDQFVPHYRGLTESSRYFSDRSREGLNAAKNVRGDIEAMNEKQQAVLGQVQTLSDRSQDEAALSRELSASLEEMAGAMDHSTAKFLETSTSVNELTSSFREVATQTEGIARSVEGTAHDLDAFGESLEKIRLGASASAEAAGAVKKDAENGLSVVQSSMVEMERIEQESQESMAAMQRLAHQTGEVAKIIEVIKELVSDTELLAFNAAIIAAQAGEEGKGFAVVAEEIRDLADRTTTSAQDIHRIVEAIGDDTGAMTKAVEATGKRIARGKQLSLSTGEALLKIVDSSTEAVQASEEIADLTGKEGERARALLDDAGRSLRSVKAIARAIQEQQTATVRIQEGVAEMKGAADQIARGMEEQVRANREFDRGLVEREEQIQSIHEATRFQMATVERAFSHFATSEQRLTKNSEKAAILSREIGELESLTERLRKLAVGFGRQGDDTSSVSGETTPVRVIV